MGEASLFSPTVTAAERDGILIVTIDNPPVNATSANVRAGLDLALDHAEASASIIGLVITGAGRTFIGGADIKEFGRPPVDPTLPAVIARIEAFGKPVVAAINGAALGGGLEVALACHYRIGSQTALVGLPEVKLGLVPGAGGTQRLPRLIGIPAALDLIVAGRSVKAQQAKSLGILDEVAADNLVAVAADAAKALCGTSFAGRQTCLSRQPHGPKSRLRPRNSWPRRVDSGRLQSRPPRRIIRSCLCRWTG